MTIRAWTLHSALLLAGTALVASVFAQQATRVRLAPNFTASWRMETTRVDEGNHPGAVDVGGGKMELRRNEATPLRLTVRDSSGKAVLESGPIEINGRRVGRAQRSDLTMTPTGQLSGDPFKRPFAALMLVLPAQPLREGTRWTATLWGPTPTPGGVQAQYAVQAIRTVDGHRVAEVAMTVNSTEGTRVTGTGTYLVRLDDGLIHRGTVRLIIEFLRAGSATDRTLAVSSRTRLHSTIRRT